MVTASGLRFAAMPAVFGFLGFFEVGIIRQSPLPGSGRVDAGHGSGQRHQGQASADDEHEGAKSSPDHRQTSLQSKPCYHPCSPPSSLRLPLCKAPSGRSKATAKPEKIAGSAILRNDAAKRAGDHGRRRLRQRIMVNSGVRISKATLQVAWNAALSIAERRTEQRDQQSS